MFLLALRIAFCNLKQRLFARILVIGSIACILTLMTSVYLLFNTLTQTLTEVRTSFFITAYLDSKVSVNHEQEILSAVKKVQGVSSAQLVSKESVLSNMGKYFPTLSQEISAIDSDAIPRYIKIKTNETESSKLNRRLKKISGIELIEINKNKYSSLVYALSTLRKLTFLMICGVLLALLCILINHFKLGTLLGLQVQKTLSVLGAKRSQIILPFFFEGAIEGFLGGVLAAMAMLVGSGILERNLTTLFSAMGYIAIPSSYTSTMAIVLIFTGLLSGSLVSVWAALRNTR